MSMIVLEVVMDIGLLKPVYELFLEDREELRGLPLGVIGGYVDVHEEYKNAYVYRLLTVLCSLRRFTWDVILGSIERQKRNQNATAFDNELILHVSRLL